MNENPTSFDLPAAAQRLLGYLNYSAGKPDARFQSELNACLGYFASQGATTPHVEISKYLKVRLNELQAAGVAAFRNAQQAEIVIPLAFDKLLQSYRGHHADLLGHLDDNALFTPFFLARCCEAVLLQGPPWQEDSRILDGALRHLNDYVGHRPVAILETRPRGEPYDHERIRPIPLYIRGAGVSHGPYQRLLSKALEILEATEPAILAEAHLDLELLDEFAVDPRAYDHTHPANRRPNYVFGEWDPHHLDLQGRYRRYVVRQLLLEALLCRAAGPNGLTEDEALFEAAAVLAGTILMATGLCGGGPATHDSTMTIGVLLPRIAANRDRFYSHWLPRIQGGHGQRLKEEAERTRQPFGGARQHLNQYLARHRALHVQQKQLAILFAEMGYAEASRHEVGTISVASVRFLSDILGRWHMAWQALEGRDLQAAADVLAEAEKLVLRGIDCGALVDPWNILGFQGLYPISNAREDSVRDPRVEELIQVVDQTFALYAELLGEAAGLGHEQLFEKLLNKMRDWANWWDQFATIEVSDVSHINGNLAVQSAEHVAQSLSQWHARREQSGDLAFWRDRIEGFRSPQAFTVVVEALLKRDDYVSALALLVNWIAQSRQVPLEDATYSFHQLIRAWLLQVLADGPPPRSASPEEVRRRWATVRRLFDYLEANAEDYWLVPELSNANRQAESQGGDEESEEMFAAAYENVTFRDSADDDQEGSIADGEESREDFDLLEGIAELGSRLKFLSTVAQLWQLAVKGGLARRVVTGEPEGHEVLANWLRTCRGNLTGLLDLLNAIHEQKVPNPSGSHESMVEFDRQRSAKEQLEYAAIETCLESMLAIGHLEAVLECEGEQPPDNPAGPMAFHVPWQSHAGAVHTALLAGDAIAAREALERFLPEFSQESLLFTALADGGHPVRILRTRLAQVVLQRLLAELPRAGLYRETYQLLQTARQMERTGRQQGRVISEFDRYFRTAYQAVLEAFLQSAEAWTALDKQSQAVIDLLKTITGPFAQLWLEHCSSLRLSSIEAITGESEWQGLMAFIQRYGRDLFHARFMTMGNLRGILHGGAGPYLDYLGENRDPQQSHSLLDALDNVISRRDAERWLQLIIEAIVENYEEYKDYNSTSSRSDYGENLCILFDFLKLKADYDRQNWRIRPLVLAHEMLARAGQFELAVAWENGLANLSAERANRFVNRLEELERMHGTRLVTIADRIRQRFVKQLALDRLRALVPEAMEAREEGENNPSFELFRKLLRDFSRQPVGAGLDVPDWLQSLHEEVENYRSSMSAASVAEQELEEIPLIPISREELSRQITAWNSSTAEE